MTALQKSTGIVPRELVGHNDSPPCFQWVWSWFCSMTSPLMWAEIAAWSSVTGIQPERWECEILLRLDVMRNSDG